MTTPEFPDDKALCLAIVTDRARVLRRSVSWSKARALANLNAAVQDAAKAGATPREIDTARDKGARS